MGDHRFNVFSLVCCWRMPGCADNYENTLGERRDMRRDNFYKLFTGMIVVMAVVELLRIAPMFAENSFESRESIFYTVVSGAVIYGFLIRWLRSFPLLPTDKPKGRDLSWIFVLVIQSFYVLSNIHSIIVLEEYTYIPMTVLASIIIYWLLKFPKSTEIAQLETVTTQPVKRSRKRKQEK